MAMTTTVALEDDDKSLCGSVLEAKNVPVIIPAEYSDYTNVFLSDSVAVLPKHTGVNNCSIDLSSQVA